MKNIEFCSKKMSCSLKLKVSTILAALLMDAIPDMPQYICQNMFSLINNTIQIILIK